MCGDGERGKDVGMVGGVRVGGDERGIEKAMCNSGRYPRDCEDGCDCSRHALSDSDTQQ